MWLSVINFLSSSTAPYLFCGIILLVFLYAALEGYARLSAVRTAVKRASGIIESTNGSQHFYEYFESLGDQFDKQPYFAESWTEFSKTVVLDGPRNLVRITRRPMDFFNTSSIIAPRLNLRLYNAMSGYLISLGLFFTFIGLVGAIAIAAKGVGAGGDTAHTQAALVQLLDVASLKFLSSVAGISLSIILSFMQKAWLNKAQLAIHRFCSSIEKRTQLITTEQLLHQWLVAQEQTTRNYSRLAEDIATEVTLQMNQVH